MFDNEPENSIALEPKVNGRVIEYACQVAGPWREAFHIDGISGWFAAAGNGIHHFFVEYDDDVSTTPPSVAVIPFLCNVLPIAWLYDATVSVGEIDAHFLDSLEYVKQSYVQMYPELTFGGRIIARKVIQNRHFRPEAPPFVLFSGGVDAVFTMLGNRALSPTLLTVWGADIFFKHEDAWCKVKQQNADLAERFQMGFATIKSSFRLFLNYAVLDTKFGKPVRDNWWHGFQHGIGLLGLAAPLALLRRTDLVTISSSYAASDPFVTRCASDPTIDSSMRFCGISCRHYDFTIPRQQKVAFICAESAVLQRSIPLRVCWEAMTDHNCCLCDKCLRTIFGIYAEGADPTEFAFPITPAKVEQIVAKLGSGGVKATAYWDAIVAKLYACETRWTHTLAVCPVMPLAGQRFSSGSAFQLSQHGIWRMGWHNLTRALAARCATPEPTLP